MSQRPTLVASASCLALMLAACGGGGDTSTPAAPAVSPSPSPAAVAISAIAPDHGQAGSVVTIAGTGFSTVAAGNVVMVNNKPCEVRSATDTALQVVVPANAGSGNFQVAVSGGTASSPVYTYELTFSTVSTFAGSQLGYLDEVGTTAKFNGPSGLALDASGTLFVADAVNHRIRSVSPAASVGSFAGSGIEGLQDGTGTGPATGAQFRFPEGLAFDAAGNLFVSDPGNNNIRRVTPASLVTTFVGAGAGMNGPAGLAFDRAGQLYVADQGNHRILKIAPGGTVTTFAGGTPGAADGTGSAAQFRFPHGLAFCGDGNLYVADENNNAIRRITPAGEVSTVAGRLGGLGFVEGPVSEARFLAPRDLTCDAEGKLYVVDNGNERIRMITPSGMVSTLAGSGAVGSTDGDGASARFSLPQYIVLDRDGSLLVSDAANERLRRIAWR